MNKRLVAAMTLAVGLALAQSPEAKQLAPTGTLRVTFLGGNPVQARVDAKTGEVTGPVADIARDRAPPGRALSDQALDGRAGRARRHDDAYSRSRLPRL